MASFNNRIFGANIHPVVKNKLKARQILAQTSNPNESRQSGILKGTAESTWTRINEVGNEVEDTTMNIMSATGNVNFKTPGENDMLANLSSRTPWARMWTAVQLFYYEEGGKEENRDVKGEYEEDVYIFNRTTGKTETRTQTVTKTVTKTFVKNELQIPMEGRVYEIGNHIFNNESNLQNPNSPIFNTGKHPLGKLSSADFNMDAQSQLKTEMQSNEFLKPPAGITSITSNTEGTMGAIKRTTVKFQVHNFHDFENIYMKYFLRPGALVVIDFGWDTSGIYDPFNEIVNRTDRTLREALFGDIGVVVQSKGDLECLIGDVVDYSAVMRDDGGFDCEVQVVSSNDGILDREVSDRNNLRNKFVSGIGAFVINRAATMLGQSFLRNDWSTSKDNLDESTQYANTFAETLFSKALEKDEYGNKAVLNNDFTMSPGAKQVGLYWQSLNEDTKTISGTGNIFISWAFFEEEILNKELALIRGETFEFGAKFDSSQSFITYEKNLVDRQKIAGIYSTNKTKLKFLYPDTWDDDETYFTKNAKLKNYELPVRPEITGVQSRSTRTGPQMTSGIETGEIETGNTKLDKAAKRIPLRELFVNLSVIQNAFKSENTVNDAIKQILDEINEDSYNVFDFKLTTGHRDNSTLMVVDRNRTSIKNQTGDELFEHLFVFSPHSPGSIVKSMDLSYNTPKGGLQNMLGIQNTDPNIPLFISSPNEEMNQTLRRLYIGLDGEGISTRYLPTLQTDFSGKDGKWIESEKDDKPIQDKTLLTEREDNSSIIEEYKDTLLSLSQVVDKDEREKLKEGYADLGDYEVDISSDKVEEVEEEEYVEGSLNPNIVYAKNLEDYFGFRSKKDFSEPYTPTTLPFGLSLSLYGISSLMPGDIFSIDYLPKIHRQFTYFQIMKVSHQLDTGGWTTSLETEMRIKPGAKLKNLYKRPEKIFLSSSWFADKIAPRCKKLFRDFDLYTEAGTDSVLVFTAKGLQKKNQKWAADDEGNFSDDVWDIIEDWNFPGNSDGRKEKEIVFDKIYYIVTFLRGAYVYEGKENLKDIVNKLNAKVYNFRVGSHV